MSTDRHLNSPASSRASACAGWRARSNWA